MMVENFNNTLSPIGHPDKKINKGTSELNTIDQMDLIFTEYSTQHPQNTQFFSAVCETFPKSITL
jgi:hypothetical protein